VSASFNIPLFSIYGEPVAPIDDRHIHIERISARAHLHHGKVEVHRHAAVTQFTYFDAGEGTCWLEDREARFKGPAVAIIPVGVAHGYALEQGADGVTASVSDDVVAEIGAPLKAASLQTAALLNLAPNEPTTHDLRRAFVAIEAETRADGPNAAEAVDAWLRLALVAISRAPEHSRALVLEVASLPASSTGGLALANRFRTLLEDHFADWSASQYVAELATTPYLLNTALRQTAGQGVAEAIHSRRLVEAKRLLRHSQMQIGEIALSAGFSDPAYFSRFFRARAGCSPQAWRDEAIASSG
jgi:AraC family transcriptional regulator, transcriptional activator of pobA